MNRNLCKTVLSAGGNLIPLMIPPKDSKGLGLMNPSILMDKTKILLNLRNINYTLYHAEGQQLFNNRFGPLAYLHPENDMHLRTYNFLCELDPNTLAIKNHLLIDTSTLDKPPVWDFVGLEDVRLVRWEDKLYGCGVRRDTKPNGEGRMELSELELGEGYVKELNRTRIEPPGPPTYCEKNWMPILDMPFHFVKWTNPTQVVKVNLITKTAETIFLGKSHIEGVADFRGGSQVIKYKDYRIALIHEVNLFKNKLQQKDATYMHRFFVWDKDWTVIKLSEPFSFMNGEIEFACGLALYKGDLLVTFGFQDNAAFLLKIPQKIIDNILGFKTEIKKKQIKKWQTTKWPTLEITTNILSKGCLLNCVFCPQKTLINVYKGERMLSLENFKKAINKIPKEITIIFSGFSEPWLNKDCTDMVLYAHEKGHSIAIFTSGIGMEIEDFEKIKHIPFSSGPVEPLIGYKGLPMNNGGFTLHLPDNENYAHHPITDKYIKLLEHIKENQNKISNFHLNCMGTVHDKIKHIFPISPTIDIWARANNLINEEKLRPEIVPIIKGKYKSAYRGESVVTCNCDEKLYHNVLLPDGNVVLCCMDYSLEHVLGNLFEQEYDDIIPEPESKFNLCRFCENGAQHQ